MCRALVFSASTILLLVMSAAAQESRSEVSLQGTGFFTTGTSGNGTSYSATETGGFLAGYRGLVYKTPDFGGPVTNSLTHTAEPSVGLAFWF